jgi:hypothetical protein
MKKSKIRERSACRRKKRRRSGKSRKRQKRLSRNVLQSRATEDPSMTQPTVAWVLSTTTRSAAQP